MGLLDFLKWPGSSGLEVAELARRLEIDEASLCAVQPEYRSFTIPKRSGGLRTICAPGAELKALQRRILRRVLARLRAHPAATGFERGHSIVTNALPHRAKAVVVRMDLKDFFPNTRSGRVERYFRAVGWNKEAAALLARLCTHQEGLPQGAPTSPRLSNLVNFRMDARLEALAHGLGAAYTRYADDMVFSFAEDDPKKIHELIRLAKMIVDDTGYQIHLKRKLTIRRQHQRQLITGLVVNRRVQLPRSTRRRLRAIAHRASQGEPATLQPAQLRGWAALQAMIDRQSGGSPF